MSELLVVRTTPLTEFFRQALQEAEHRLACPLGEHTEHYIVNLLVGFARAEAFYSGEATNATRFPVLAHLLAKALGSERREEQERLLQRLGDVALFSAGFLSHGFARRLVDVDYYVAMGSSAYRQLAESASSSGLRSIRVVFEELAERFVTVMDTLAFVAHEGQPTTVESIERYCEIWMLTGSRQAYTKLAEWGITPMSLERPERRH